MSCDQIGDCGGRLALREVPDAREDDAPVARSEQLIFAFRRRRVIARIRAAVND